MDLLLSNQWWNAGTGRTGDGLRTQPAQHGTEFLRIDDHLIALNDALGELESLDPQLARIVDLRFFGGLTIDETAEVLNVAPITIDRAWKTAKSWLHLELKEGI